MNKYKILIELGGTASSRQDVRRSLMYKDFIAEKVMTPSRR